jgi:glycerol-3-phosphate dehydrogenase
MHRPSTLQQLSSGSQWDLVIIGGGATGLGAAVDAASRGYKVLLVEQYDFAKGTSSRSTKLVHGGVRYLQQGNIKLVKEALRERGYLLKNAPHLTSIQAFIVPAFRWWEKAYYAIGLNIYDLLAGKLSLGKTKILSRKQTISRLPAISTKGLSGGVLYYDGQFDDSRLCTDLAITAINYGASLVNYCKAVGFEKEKEKIVAVLLEDTLTGNFYTVPARSVINATGVFTDALLQMDDSTREAMVSPSQGIHLVVDKHFFPGDDAMMIPKTDDGRVLFAVPWHKQVVLGTTDTPIETAVIEPKPLEEEINFILEHINRYGSFTIRRSDVKSVFVGLRPLVKKNGTGSTALLSRDHTLLIAASGLVTITGGKWTTYRKMAEDAVDNAVFVAKLAKRECITRDLRIGDPAGREKILTALIAEDPALVEKLHPAYPYTWAEILYAIRYEMAQTAEDLLARRTRLLLLDAEAAITLAPAVAAFIQKELGKDEAWKEAQVAGFTSLAKQYLLG